MDLAKGVVRVGYMLGQFRVKCESVSHTSRVGSGVVWVNNISNSSDYKSSFES